MISRRSTNLADESDHLWTDDYAPRAICGTVGPPKNETSGLPCGPCHGAYALSGGAFPWNGLQYPSPTPGGALRPAGCDLRVPSRSRRPGRARPAAGVQQWARRAIAILRRWISRTSIWPQPLSEAELELYFQAVGDALAAAPNPHRHAAYRDKFVAELQATYGPRGG
jgi:hypothetical protein